MGRGSLALATLVGESDLELSESERKEWAAAIQDLQRFYPLVQLSDKTAAWLNFSMVTGAIVLSRYRSISAKHKAARPRAVVAMPSKPADLTTKVSSSPVASTIIPGFGTPAAPAPVIVDDRGESNMRAPSEFMPMVGVSDEPTQ